MRRGPRPGNTSLLSLRRECQEELHPIPHGLETIHTCKYTHTRTHAQVYIRVCVRVCVYTYICVYVCSSLETDLWMWTWEFTTSLKSLEHGRIPLRGAPQAPAARLTPGLARVHPPALTRPPFLARLANPAAGLRPSVARLRPPLLVTAHAEGRAAAALSCDVSAFPSTLLRLCGQLCYPAPEPLRGGVRPPLSVPRPDPVECLPHGRALGTSVACRQPCQPVQARRWARTQQSRWCGCGENGLGEFPHEPNAVKSGRDTI